MFEWLAPGPATPLGIALSGEGGARRDTLRFDGTGRAELWLPSGRHRYLLDGGGGGLLAVDRWSEEWLPRPVSLLAREAHRRLAPGVTSSRQWIWLFALVIVALAVEWLARRRLGLR